eukprot:TRINITY_DN7190_c0_g1_i2.p2 TRINITY_DN7190_c0_g1~~TRINITY_DN7190_c0_g1_i2.p2  ORF type:complete len:159 (+),score=24.29 TRINITY_DN7190_c0_g1_i2:61-537(+)
MQTASATRSHKRTAGVLCLAAAAVLCLSTFVAEPQTDFLMRCTDNSGAWNLRAIGTTQATGRRGPRDVRATRPGDRVSVVGRTSGPEPKCLRAVIVRMRKSTKSPHRNGIYHNFDETAAILIKTYKKAEPIGSKCSGAMHPRVTKLWPHLIGFDDAGK